MRGFIIGAVLLTVLDAVVSTTAAAQRASALLSIPGSVITYIVSPEKPAIPDLRKRAAAPAGPADNPFAAATANQQVVSASWSTASTAAPAPTVQSTAEYLLGVST